MIRRAHGMLPVSQFAATLHFATITHFVFMMRECGPEA